MLDFNILAKSACNMAGHSKWANIQHRKSAQDAKRGRAFTKLIREITVAARLGDPEPASNPRLRAAMDKALATNVPKDTIERAIKRGAGDQEGTNLEEIRYEGYAPGGVAVMVDCLTDNRNRTVAEVRHAFSKCGGSLGTDGSVAYLFAKAGIISFPTGSDEDQIMEVSLETGVDDIVTNEDGSIDVLTSPDDMLSTKEALLEVGLTPENAEVTMQASANVSLGLNEAGKMVRLLEMLEDLDDVQNVYSNADISAEVLNQIA
jgi:YebC/PmpR family DNA-binding regulatory protein